MIEGIIELTIMADVHLSCLWANETDTLPFGSWEVLESVFQ